MVGEVAWPLNASNSHVLLCAVRLYAPTALWQIAFDAVKEAVREDHRFQFDFVPL